VGSVTFILGSAWAQAQARLGRKRPWRLRATYVRRSGVGYFFGAYDFHADVLFGGYRLAKTTSEVLAFYKYIRRRYPEHLRIYLINDNLVLHWTSKIGQWAESHNVELVPIPTYASYFHRIECQFQPLREFVINASDYASHGEVGRAFRRYVQRRNSDHGSTRIRLLESRSRVA
jgi:hypothetical protein